MSGDVRPIGEVAIVTGRFVAVESIPRPVRYRGRRRQCDRCGHSHARTTLVCEHRHPDHAPLADEAGRMKATPTRLATQAASTIKPDATRERLLARRSAGLSLRR